MSPGLLWLALVLPGVALGQEDPPEEEGEVQNEDEGEGEDEGEKENEGEPEPPPAEPEPEPPPAEPEPPPAEPEPPPAAPQPEDDWGDDDGWGDDDDSSGFADTTAETTTTKERPWSLSGYLRSQEALWVERLTSEPLALARQTGELTFNLSWNEVRGKATVHGEIDPKYLLTDRYDGVKRVYGWRLEPRELYLGSSFGPIEVTAGRQVVAWGEGIIISPTDVVNARDARDPGMTDLDDLRRPVTMLRLQAFLGSHRLELLGVPEADFGLRSPPEGPFGLMPGLAEAAESPTFVDSDELLYQIDSDWEHLQPRWALDQFQAFGRWSWRGRGFDLALYGATLLDKQGVIVNPEGEVNLLDVTELGIPLDHRRYTFAGHSGSAVIQSFVLRWELAAEWGRYYNLGELIIGTNDGPEFNALSTQRDVYTAMAGVGYTGIARTRIDVEAARGWLPRGRANLTMPVGETQYALRVNHLLLKDRLSLDAFAVGLGTKLQYGFVASAAATYELKDGLHATLGYVTYQPSEEIGPLIGMDTHDRLFAQAKWKF